MDDNLVLRELWDPATGTTFYAAMGRHEISPYMRENVIKQILKELKGDEADDYSKF